jgi:hypothetical protein
MNNDGVPKDDVKVPEGDLGSQITSDFESGKDLLVTIVSAMDEEQVCTDISLSYRFCSYRSFLRLFPTKKPPKEPTTDHFILVWTWNTRLCLWFLYRFLFLFTAIRFTTVLRLFLCHITLLL